jgi:hypothetical protein
MEPFLFYMYHYAVKGMSTEEFMDILFHGILSIKALEHLLTLEINWDKL